MNLPKRSVAYLALLLTSAIWGVAVTVIKYTLKFTDPLTFLFFRFLISSIVLLPFFLKHLRDQPLYKRDWLWLFLMGNLSTTVVLSLLFVGMQYTSAIDVSLISILSPIMIVYAGAHFLKEKVTSKEKIGLTIAVIGAFIGLGEPLFRKNHFQSQALIGNALVFLSYLAWATYTILHKKNSTKYHPIEITFFNFFSGLITLGPIFLIRNLIIGELPITLSPAALPGILYMSLLSSCVAYFTYNLGVSLIEASEATLFGYLKPIFVAPLAYFWLKEKITLPFLIGAIIATIGVVISEWK